MKRNLLLILFLSVSVAVFAQTSPAKDTTKIWTIHGKNTFLLNQSSFSHWASGGTNAFAANVVLDYDFNYKKEKWSWDNKVILGYGLSKQNNTDWRKNDDRIILNSLLGYQFAKYWLYTFYMNFQTQFANGYNYDANNVSTLISAPFAPAYLTFGPGIAYKKSNSFRVNFSPLAGRLTTVSNDYLSSLGSYGVTPGSSSLFQFGASLDGYYKVDIVENITIENILKLYSNYLKNPQNIYMDYTFNVFMKVNDWVTVNAGVELINDPLAKIPSTSGIPGDEHSYFQVKQIFGVGLTYKF